MLIYVDKKKEKQKKIRRLILILFTLFFILINFRQFNLSLNHTDQSLTGYKTIKHLNLWYKNADVVHLFTSNKNQVAAIIVPETLNRENTLSVALALSKLPPKEYHIYLSPLLKEQDSLTNLIKTFFPTAIFNTSADASDIIIATKLKDIAPHIIKNKLFPHTLNYKHTKKIQQRADIKEFMQNAFPPTPAPQNMLEQESMNLQSFISAHRKALKDFIFYQKEPQFTKQSFFLQNIRLCLKSKNNNLSCALDTSSSLKKNLAFAQTSLSDTLPIIKAYLLTSDMKITPNTHLSEDEGLRFIYQNREALLLPENIKLLDNISKAFYILKEKAGINPLFDAPDMYFYKFKIKEVANDKDI